MKFKNKILLLTIIFILLETFIPILNISKSIAEENNIQNNPEYIEIRNELTDILKEKDFSDKDKSLLYEVLDSLWYSYDNIGQAFSVIGYPSKEKYINDNLIVPVKMLTSLKGVDNLNTSFAAATTADYGDGRIEINYLEDISHDYLIYTMQHELRHVIRKVTDDEYYNLIPKHHRIMNEGWAVLGSLSEFDVNSSFHQPYACKTFETQEDGYVLNVGYLAPSEEYGMLANILMKYTVVVGYENMLKWEKGELTASELLSIMDEALGEETAERFITDLNETVLNYQTRFENGNSVEIYPDDIDTDKIIDAEEIILNLLKSRLSQLNNKNDIQEFFNFYYIYKKYFCTRYEERRYVELGGGNFGLDVHDHTNEKINADDIENLLVQKVKEYDALPKFSVNSELNEMTIKAMFSTDNPYCINAPVNLFNADYQYNDGEIWGELVLDGMKIKVDIEGKISTSYSSSYKVDTDNILLRKTPKELTQIEITTLPNKIYYYVGDYFNPEGMVVTAYYDDGSSEVIRNYEVIDGSNLQCNQETITVKYTRGDITKTATQNITVTERKIKKIGITSAPIKKNYAVGEDFNPGGMVVTAYYDDGSSKIITDYMMANTTNLREGQPFVVVFYVVDNKTYTALQPIIVKPAIGQLLIVDPPTKTTYMQGEDFDKSGLIAGFEDKNGNTVIIMKDTGLINIGDFLGEITIPGVGKAVYGDVDIIDGDKLTYGQKYVRASFEYEGVTYIGEIDITVLNGSEPYQKHLRGINIKENEKSYRSMPIITPGDIRVIATYDDGSTEEITEYTIVDQYVDKNGERKVTISYQDGDETITQTLTTGKEIVENETVQDAADDNETQKEIVNSDETIAQTRIPNTGTYSISGILAIIAVVSAIIINKRK